MSNRDRIQRKALEAEATRTEKAAGAAKPKKKRPARKAAAKTATPRRKAGAKGRVKIVWTLCSPTGKVLKTFPYREKAAAQAEADGLSAKKGSPYVVRSERQPMADDE